MQLQLVKNHSSGFALLGVLILSTTLGGSILYNLLANKASQRAQLFLDHKTEFDNNVRTLQMIFEDKETCQYSGLINLVIDPNLPWLTPITIKFPDGNVFMENGGNTGLLNVIPGGLSFKNKLTSLGTNGTTSVFSANIHIVQKPTIGGSKQYEQDVFLTLEMDSFNKVLNCYGGGTRVPIVSLFCDTLHIGGLDPATGIFNDLPITVDPCNLAPIDGPGIAPMRTLPRQNPAGVPMAVEAACPNGMRVVNCTIRCQGKNIQRCVSLPTRGGTRCWGQCLDIDGNVCGVETGSTPQIHGWAQINMSCTSD